MSQPIEDEDAKFHAWLLTAKGALVTCVRGERAWNLTVARQVADEITGKTTREEAR